MTINTDIFNYEHLDKVLVCVELTKAQQRLDQVLSNKNPSFEDLIAASRRVSEALDVHAAMREAAMVSMGATELAKGHISIQEMEALWMLGCLTTRTKMKDATEGTMGKMVMESALVLEPDFNLAFHGEIKVGKFIEDFEQKVLARAAKKPTL